MRKYIIAAVADNGAIGRDNSLLWHISGDMKYFRRLTSGSPVIMGRKTFESVGRPLPGRRNIIVSRSCSHIEGAEVVTSLDEAFALAAGGNASAGGRKEDPASAAGPQQCFVIGGGEIYRQAIGEADRLYITYVHCPADGADTFFPEISPEEWKEESRSELMSDGESGLQYEFVVYDRK